MTEKTLATKVVFQGKLLRVEKLDVELPSGAKAVREVVRHSGAAVILARLPDGRFVFVRQFRKAIERELTEVVAGCLEKGETPAECAARELMEETGYSHGKLTHLGLVYPTPGYSDEGYNVYYAELSAVRGRDNPDEDEKIELVYMTADEIEETIARGEMFDAKTMIAWLLYKQKIAGKESRA